jgi:hypothetical protein
VIVREDLPQAQQVVQACHAVAEAVHAFGGLQPEHPHLVVCGVEDEPSLHRARDHLTRAGVRCRTFRDSDLDNQLTALASEPVRAHGRRPFRRFRLLRFPESAKKECSS